MKLDITNQNDDNISFLGKEGVIVYPIFDQLKREWYMEVDLSKRFPDKPKSKTIVTYKTKPIGKKSILNIKDVRLQWEATLNYWRNKIEDENRKAVQRPE